MYHFANITIFVKKCFTQQILPLCVLCILYLLTLTIANITVPLQY